MRKHLISNNFPRKDVDEVIDYFYKLQDSQIRGYINNMHRMGYNPEMVRQGLLRQGYAPEIIDGAFSGQTINIRHEVNFSGKTFFGIFFIFLLLGGGAYIFFYTDIIQGSDVLLDVSVYTDSEYKLRDNIKYQVVITSMGASERFDAKIRYVIQDSSGSVKKTYSETLAVDTKASSTGSITLPSTVGIGTYYLTATAEYDGKSAESTAQFNIVESKNTQQIIQDDEIIIDEEEISTNPTSAQGTFGETIEIIKAEVQKNPEKISDCARFIDQKQKDACYSIIASITYKSNACGYIIDKNMADDCYLMFIMSGEQGICEHITSIDTKTYCEQVAIVYQMNQAYQKNDTTRILALSEDFEPDIYNNDPIDIDYSEYYNRPTSFI